jgi:cell division transport system ATP-binding protein
VPDVLAMVGLNEKANRLPHELSGGEQQRVAIARAVVNKPAILLADEPTGNLDPLTSGGIMQVLQRINAGGTTVIMATHDNAIVDQMQRRVIELVQGEIVRDELQGGYGMTAEIALRDSGMTAEIGIPGLTRGSRGPTSTSPTFSAPSESAGRVAQPPVPAAQPVTREQLAAQQEQEPVRAEVPAPLAAAPRQAPVTPPRATEPREPDPVTDQLGLAEKLGLRAPGERIDPAKDQNVGPTS